MIAGRVATGTPTGESVRHNLLSKRVFETPWRDLPRPCAPLPRPPPHLRRVADRDGRPRAPDDAATRPQGDPDDDGQLRPPFPAPSPSWPPPRRGLPDRRRARGSRLGLEFVERLEELHRGRVVQLVAGVPDLIKPLEIGGQRCTFLHQQNEFRPWRIIAAPISIRTFWLMTRCSSPSRSSKRCSDPTWITQRRTSACHRAPCLGPASTRIRALRTPLARSLRT